MAVPASAPLASAPTAVVAATVKAAPPPAPAILPAVSPISPPLALLFSFSVSVSSFSIAPNLLIICGISTMAVRIPAPAAVLMYVSFGTLAAAFMAFSQCVPLFGKAGWAGSPAFPVPRPPLPVPGIIDDPAAPPQFVTCTGIPAPPPASPPIPPAPPPFSFLRLPIKDITVVRPFITARAATAADKPYTAFFIPSGFSFSSSASFSIGFTSVEFAKSFAAVFSLLRLPSIVPAF